MIGRPEPSESQPYFQSYIDQVAGDDLEAALERPGLSDLIRGLATGLTDHRYEPGKWTLGQSIQHVIDTERIFAVRALRIARGDETPLPGYDQDAFAESTSSRALSELADELDRVRASTLDLFRSFSADDLRRVGTSSDGPLSTRAAGWIIAGHERHHIAGTDRYLERVA
ncbi:DinB family protein [Rubrivirga sp.]|uniref:DinB family protein n=1 Tax=Rubrivirga sp. TaxID=1885344 RepID=UPI003C708023